MTDLEINEAIADHVGWKWYAVEKGGWFYRKGGHGYTYRIEEAGKYTKEDAEKQLCYGEPMSVVKIPVPSYTTDLNAMHEAEEMLTDKRTDYSRAVWKLCHLPETRSEWVDFYLIHASAPRRAEAFLRTVGKWKEAKP